MSEKEKLIEMIDDMPAYKIGYVLAYVQGITAEDDPSESVAAYNELLQMRKPLSGELDYDKELAEARMEKYESIN
ncbi:MAG: hypothetical protein PHW47_08775 [Lachnospira sp.]|nr:hypothetical protein [Lachnospira sp.]